MFESSSYSSNLFFFSISLRLYRFFLPSVFLDQHNSPLSVTGITNIFFQLICLLTLAFEFQLPISFKIFVTQAGEMAQCVRALVALLEDPGLVPTTHMQFTTICNSVLLYLTPHSDLFRQQAHIWCTDIHAGKIPIHINKNPKRFYTFFVIIFVFTGLIILLDVISYLEYLPRSDENC